ncbi:MAG: sialate O-acetylesterase, partial [Bacteroidetes bacterium]|nr:sialate O-acetylesterase [Bacteroidota bacterium]
MVKITLAFILGIFILQPLTAQVRLPRLIRDSMILQRDSKVKIWGWAAPKEKVTVLFNKKRFSATADPTGKWSLFFPPTKAGGPYTIDINASNHIQIKEVLFGDVWLCSGQSNMMHQLALHSVRYAGEIASADYPQIRHFWVPNVANMQATQDDLPGGYWKWANPADVTEFSAVAYFFAKEIYERYHVPIGLINASWGGTPIEAWMSEDGFKDFPAILSRIQKNKDTTGSSGPARRGPGAGRRQAAQDKGQLESWFSPSYIPKGWRSINIPGYWEDQGVRDLDGVVWYRREIDVPAAMANAPAKVFLGRIVDADVLYINGRQVGATTYMYPQRRYPVPPGTLKPGKNLFVIRVTNNAGKGGFVPDK